MKALKLLRCIVNAVRYELRDAKRRNLTSKAADALLRRHLIFNGLRGCPCTHLTPVTNKDLDRVIENDRPCQIFDLGPRENGVALDFNNALPGDRLLFIGNKAVAFFDVVTSGKILLSDCVGSADNGITIGYVERMASEMAKQEMLALQRALRLHHRPPAKFEVKLLELEPPHIIRNGDTCEASQLVAGMLVCIP